MIVELYPVYTFIGKIHLTEYTVYRVITRYEITMVCFVVKLRETRLLAIFKIVLISELN